TISRDIGAGRGRGPAGRRSGPPSDGTARLPPRRRGLAGRARRGPAPVPPPSRCEGAPAAVTAMSAQPIPPPDPLEIRRLSYSDLPQVITIERRSFPTPWSLAMFVLELSKPSGVCLAATIDGALVGYLVCSRYDRVW